MTLYDSLLAAGCELDSHESDLYVKWSTTALELIKAHGSHVAKMFRSDVDGEWWLELPFEFSPFWRKREG